MDERPPDVALASQRASGRLLSILCLVYLALLFYASLMPFDFAGDQARVDAQLRRAWQYWPFGTAVHTSRADMLSNVMLYVPLGFFLATRLTLNARRSRWLALLGGMAVCGATSFLVEIGQVFSTSRIASATDLLMNLAGGSAGAAAGALFGAQGWHGLTESIRRRYTVRPLGLVAALLLVVLALDAVYPLLPTLDVGTIKHNLRESVVSLENGFSRHPWHHWIVRRVGVYGVLTLLLGASMRRPTHRRWMKAAILVVCFAAAAEAVKPFIVGRNANAANVASSTGGALLGLVLGTVFARRLSPRTRALLPVTLLAAYLVYVAWTPFVFTWAPSRLADRMPSGVQWLPLYHYAMGARAEDVRLFLRTIMLVGALTYAVMCRWRRDAESNRTGVILKAALLTGCFGLSLEVGQFFLDRVPSTTDVFCFAVGGALGSWVHVRYPPRAGTDSQKEV